jgi:hypothetical protein
MLSTKIWDLPHSAIYVIDTVLHIEFIQAFTVIRDQPVAA